MSLTAAGTGLRLDVRDDGQGFAVDASASRGLGLVSMRDRAEAAGGSLTLWSWPGAGTTVRLEVPA